MPSFKQVPIAEAVSLPDAPAAMETVKTQITPRKKPAETAASVDEGTDDPPIEQTVTDETMDEAKLIGYTKEARDDNDGRGTLATEAACIGLERTRKSNDDEQKNSNIDVQNQHDTAVTLKRCIDEVSEDEPVNPHDLDSINHDILARLMAAPFHARAMHMLYTYKENKDWDVTLPQLNIPIISQKRCIEVMKKHKVEEKDLAKKLSPWRTLSQHNKAVPKSPQNTLLQQNLLNDPQFHQQNQYRQTAPPIPQANSVPLQLFNQSHAPNMSSNHNSTLKYNLPNAQHNQHFSQPHASVPTASNSYTPVAGFPYPRFFPPAFNNGYMNNFQMYQLAQAQNAARNAAAPIPQATASARTLLNESNTQLVAKLPVAFGFQLNNDMSRVLAQQATQTLSDLGKNALKSAKSKSGKAKTPRKSPSTTPHRSPRMSPAQVPTAEQKKKGLPEGWTAKTFQRAGGDTAGQTDTYFYSPVTNIKFRSKNKIKIFVEIMEEVGGDEKRAFKLFKERGHRV